MKTVSIFLLALSLLCSAAFAGPVAGTAAVVRFSAFNTIGITNWLPVFTSTVKGVKAISVYNTASLPIEVGVAFASDTTTANVKQFIVPASSSVGIPAMYPLSLGYASQVAVRVSGSTGGAAAVINSGELQMSLFYN